MAKVILLYKAGLKKVKRRRIVESRGSSYMNLFKMICTHWRNPLSKSKCVTHAKKKVINRQQQIIKD